MTDLKLEELTSWRVPDSFTVTGVAEDGDSGLLVWGAQPALLELKPDRSARRIGLPDSMVVRALRLTGNFRYQIIDATAGAVVTLDGTRVVGRDPLVLAPGARIDAAVSLGEIDWLLGISDSLGDRFELVRAGPTGVRPVASYPGRTFNGQRLFYLLEAAGSRVVVAQVSHPFAAELLDPASGSRIALEPMPDSLFARDTTGGGIPPLWRLVSAVPVGCGLLLSLADLTGDARLLALYDRDARFIRARALNAPFSLIHSSRRHAELLAARRAGHLELVTYRWHW